MGCRVGGAGEVEGRGARGVRTSAASRARVQVSRGARDRLAKVPGDKYAQSRQLTAVNAPCRSTPYSCKPRPCSSPHQQPQRQPRRGHRPRRQQQRWLPPQRQRARRRRRRNRPPTCSTSDGAGMRACTSLLRTCTPVARRRELWVRGQAGVAVLQRPQLQGDWSRQEGVRVALMRCAPNRAPPASSHAKAGHRQQATYHIFASLVLARVQPVFDPFTNLVQRERACNCKARRRARACCRCCCHCHLGHHATAGRRVKGSAVVAGVDGGDAARADDEGGRVAEVVCKPQAIDDALQHGRRQWPLCQTDLSVEQSYQVCQPKRVAPAIARPSNMPACLVLMALASGGSVHAIAHLAETVGAGAAVGRPALAGIVSGNLLNQFYQLRRHLHHLLRRRDVGLEHRVWRAEGVLGRRIEARRCSSRNTRPLCVPRGQGMAGER